ncbi:MAG: RNA methyltransferase, partial [Clostridia bacterium]|nr:RNA methyltransferase [Clostridia bacterium]
IPARPRPTSISYPEGRASRRSGSACLPLCTCLLKGDKFETVIRHSVELGVTKIVPVLSTNCVSRPDAKSLKSKEQRWQKIANEAAGQCGRGVLPTLLSTTDLSALAKTFNDYDLVLFFYELGGEPLGETLWENDSAKKIAIITGPEGGFTASEAEMLANAGAKTISLGKRILRAETAPLAALTGVMLLTDNLE